MSRASRRPAALAGSVAPDPAARMARPAGGGRAWSAAAAWATALGFLCATEAAAAARLSLTLEPATLGVGEQAILTLTVEGASSLDRIPSVPHPPEVQLRSAGQSSNFSFVNGRMSRSISVSFVVSADRAGEFTLGPVELTDGKERLRSEAVTLRVVERGRGGSGSPRAAPGPARGEDGAADGGEVLFVRATVDQDRATLGEQVNLRFRIYRRQDVPVLDVNLRALPSTEGFWREDLPPERSSQVTLNGWTYEVNELTYALFPTQSGRLEIGAGEVECLVQERGRRSRDPFDFFGSFPTQRRVVLRSRPLAVRVDPLPEPKPDDFTGGVGDYRLTARCDPVEAAQNDPVTLTITVEGTGNVAMVGDPEIPRLPGVRVYPSGSEVKVSRRGDLVAGTKTFRAMLVPENTGRREVPPIRLSVYDPGSRRYVRLQSEPMSFRVGPAVGGGLAGSGEVARVGRDIRGIRPASRLAPYGTAEPWRRAGPWALLFVPAVLVAGGVAWRARRERRAADWGRWVSRGAPARFRRELERLERAGGEEVAAAYDRLDSVVERYFTDRFHLPVRGMTRDELAARLEGRGVDAGAVELVRTLLDRCDFARFAPGSRRAEDLAELLALARSVADRIERARGSRETAGGRGGSRPRGAALLLWFLVLATGIGVLPPGMAPGAAPLLREAAAAPRASSAEARALAAQGDAAYRDGDYAEAIRRYAEILRGGRESADLYLDLGNAAYRLGLIGWSVYFYERGRRLSPGDPDLKANLDLVLQETKDRIPEAGTSRFLAELVAMQERSSPAATWWMFVAAAWAFGLWAAARIAFGEPPGGGRRALVRGLGAVLAGWFVLWSGLIAIAGARSWTEPNAVVVADELPVRTNPEPEATVEFTLHAGTRVRVGRELRGHREVVFSEKLRGWGSADGLALLGSGRPPDLPGLAVREAP